MLLLEKLHGKMFNIYLLKIIYMSLILFKLFDIVLTGIGINYNKFANVN